MGKRLRGRRRRLCTRFVSLRSLAAIKLQNRIQVAASYYPSRITFHAGGIVIEAENFYYPSNPRKSLGNDRAECEVDIWPTSEILPPTAERLPGLDGLVTYSHEPVTAEMIASAPNLKVISNVGVGYNHIDAEAARAQGVAVGNTPGVLSETTADTTFAQLLAAARHLVPAGVYVQEKR